jgi:hypothetical protein
MVGFLGRVGNRQGKALDGLHRRNIPWSHIPYACALCMEEEILDESHPCKYLH